jgi:hypothetical protein
MTAIMTATPRQTSPLLDLPAELRNLIYGYVAVKDEPINAGIGYTLDLSFERILMSQYPPLASVCNSSGMKSYNFTTPQTNSFSATTPSTPTLPLNLELWTNGAAY